MTKQLLFSLTLLFLFLFLFHCTTLTLAAHSSAPTPAPAPAKAAPAATTKSITKILKQAGKFTFLIRLMKSTQVDIRITTQLKRTKEGLTLFAPIDSAFSGLKAGTFNHLTDQQQDQLVLFHVIPDYLPTSQLPTVINPLRTLAGDSRKDQFPLNITTAGDQVTLSTGIVNATMGDTIYSDNQLAVYEVDTVLLPVNIFKSGLLAPAVAPAAAVSPSSKPEKEDSTASSEKSAGSGACRHGIMMSIGVSVIAAFSL